jgi:bifunctional DNase/RNase
MVKAKLEDVAVSSDGDAFLVLLSTEKGEMIPIAIGALEAMSIAAGRNHEKFQRHTTSCFLFWTC